MKLPRICVECSEREDCLSRKQEDDGIRKFYCLYCKKDVIVTGVAPCRAGIHFCRERCEAIL